MSFSCNVNVKAKVSLYSSPCSDRAFNAKFYVLSGLFRVSDLKWHHHHHQNRTCHYSDYFPNSYGHLSQVNSFTVKRRFLLKHITKPTTQK